MLNATAVQELVKSSLPKFALLVARKFAQTLFTRCQTKFAQFRLFTWKMNSELYQNLHGFTV